MHSSVKTKKHKHLHNSYDIETLKAMLAAEDFDRITISFYRYVIQENPEMLRDELYLEWNELGVLGRIYLAREGINAQLSVPEHNYKKFLQKLELRYPAMPIKKAVAENKESFYKLIVRLKKKILADGMNDDSYDVTNVGNHLNAEEFNKALDTEGTIVVDIRNHYESEIGHFKEALLPDVDSFREELPLVKDMLKGKENNKILLYCTGGIRCEKTSAWLKHQGFKDVNQLHGGIIDYAKQVKEQGLENKFIGKNFVFDSRMGERISDDVIAKCHQCGKPADTHRNCEWQPCHILFIQCKECDDKMQGCCSPECQDYIKLPEEKQRALRKELTVQTEDFFHSRRRPNESVRSNI